MDQIILRNLEFHAPHGYYEEERREGRTFLVDVDADVSTVRAGQSDDLIETVDYRDIARVVVDVMSGESVHLIERLAEKIADGVLDEISAIAHVEVRVRKKATGVPGNPEFVGVVIHRSRP
jgi:dihydroneopterin aldolase